MNVHCKHCGSTDIEESNTMCIGVEVTEWILDGDGKPQPEDFGDQRDFPDTIEADGNYWCCGCNTELSDDDLAVSGTDEELATLNASVERTTDDEDEEQDIDEDED